MLFIGLTLIAFAPGALALDFTMVMGDPGMVNHWPGADGHIGTADDYISASCSPNWCSETNTNGYYCFNAFDFGVYGGDTGIPPGGFEALTFIEGTLGIDMSVAVNGGGPLMTSMNVSGTEPLSGHGPYLAYFSQVNGGSYDPGTKAFTMNVDFLAELSGPPDSALNFEFGGTAWVIQSADFGNITGDSYLDEVAIPRAIAQSASALVLFRVTGIIPAAEGGSWGSMPHMATLLAFTDAVPTEQISWGRVKSSY